MHADTEQNSQQILAFSRHKKHKFSPSLSSPMLLGKTTAYLSQQELLEQVCRRRCFFCLFVHLARLQEGWSRAEILGDKNTCYVLSMCRMINLAGRNRGEWVCLIEEFRKFVSAGLSTGTIPMAKRRHERC